MIVKDAFDYFSIKTFRIANLCCVCSLKLPEAIPIRTHNMFMEK